MILKDARILITGGGTGLGADMARSFAAQGSKVVVVGRRIAPLEALAATKNISALTADVTDEASMKDLFNKAGQIDIVIANAGAAESAPFGKVTLAHWNQMLAVNLTGVFLTLREGLNQMQGWGRLISVASTAGLKGYGYVAPYAAAKHGVVGMTKSLALEIAQTDITANTLCPGFLDTEMTDRSIANIVAKTGKSPDDALAALTANNPQKRLIQPAEVTAAALWLCGPGSGAINGQAIAIDGGET